MNTYVDASYIQYLGEAGKPYMMPVSPWFYTNMPGYNKNWAWHSDDLWYDRWVEVSYIEPEWVEIISWNDYGESHYIGPLNDKAYVAFGIGKAPYNYVLDMPHDAWRLQLPYAIDLYKSGKPSITEESLVIWYRRLVRYSCSTGGTTGNTALQLQIEYHADTVFEDKVFFTALLASNATVTVSIGGLEFPASWESEPDGGIGLYHGSFPFDSHLLGEVIVTVSRQKDIVNVKGPAVSTTCPSGLVNFNAWVGGAKVSAITAVSPKLSLSEQTCIAGSGARNFAGICGFTCKYGYCPIGACYCTAMGKKKTLPKATGDKGYPANGDANYAGLCDFSCNYGYCPKSACSSVERPPYIPASSPFTPPACVRGDGEGSLAGLCSFACAFGFCLVSSCTCLSTGPLVAPPAPKDVKAVPDTDDLELYQLLKPLCDFACSRDYCPTGACKLGLDNDDDADGSDLVQVIIDSEIWKEEHPAVSCGSACVLVLPPYTLPGPTVIDFDGGYSTVLNVAWETPAVKTLPDGEVVTTTSITHILQNTIIPVPPTSDGKVPPVAYTSAADKQNGPDCVDKSKCDGGCHFPIFCDGPCVIGCGGGGFAASNDPHPLPNPNPGPTDPDNEDPDEDDCDDDITTVTDLWVSCKTIDSTSTSCTTTSSHVHTGCSATATATTTEAAAWYINDPNEDQGQDGGAGTGLLTTSDDRKITTVKPTTTTAAERPVQTRNVDQGILTCETENKGYQQGDPDHYVTLDQMDLAAGDSCWPDWENYAIHSNSAGWTYNNVNPNYFHSITYSKGENCPPPPDFSGKEQHPKGVALCLERMRTIINSCDTAANGHDRWKAGGTFYRDCVTWTLRVEQPPI
ncbi:unnamed protein product [Penicillium egyptiacum]|uniref:Uncharacterized protein n=1 Tax=Penicillium egyptiacum TaxID=1303716 RepID=A0A9W4P7Q8_9EURO|nr:unnamed protein product [Penicillium egyptiacum]